MLTLAMYLPGFHACTYNDLWWSPGFTEWDLLRASKSGQLGHRPRRGYYDLSDPQVMVEQFAEASAAGIGGFNLYHYWSAGDRPLSRPFDTLMRHADAEVRFSLCWANHSWTRTWSGRSGERQTLLAQRYETDMSSHYRVLVGAFSDKRYIRFRGRPLFQIYRPDDTDHIRAFVDGLRRETQRLLGCEPFVLAAKTSPRRIMLDCYDGTTLWEPNLSIGYSQRRSASWQNRIATAIRESTLLPVHEALRRALTPRAREYGELCDRLILGYRRSLVANQPGLTVPMVFCRFDNSPRYGRRARVVKNADAAGFVRLVQRVMDVHKPEILMLNAWNEWGEGMVFEPSTTYGADLLQALARLQKPDRCDVRSPPLCVH